MPPIASNRTTRVDHVVNPQDPSTWLKPGEKLIGADGRDWAWCYVWFKDIPSCSGYAAGTNGTIWSRRRALNGRTRRLSEEWCRVKAPPHNRTGYRRVSLCIDGLQIERRIHQIVLETFVGPRPPGFQGCHNNGIKADCRLRNLRWDSQLENNRDRVRHGTIPRGERHHLAKITEATIATIYELRARGLYQAQIGERVGLTQAVISKILRGDIWKHVPRP